MPDTAEQLNTTNDIPAPIFAIQKLYVTDISLESPNTPMAFLNNEAEPQFEVQFRHEAKGFDNGFFETSLTVTAKAVAGEHTLFLVELTQAGMFQIENIPQTELEPILSISCPNILFPYLREAISDLTTRAGFPPLMLQPINFEAIFMQQRADNAENQPVSANETITPSHSETQH